jgi:hypothetical protein
MDSRRVTGKQPTTLITDALPSYAMASPLGFPSATHIHEAAFKGRVRSNRMERMNGGILDREGTMRGLGRTSSLGIRGFRTHHSSVKPHEASEGQTPAERQGSG